jgi:TfoX/Sxy family transcriptional regulator of competence genes
MAFNEALAERVRKLLSRRKNITEKKMFGGIGFLLNGNLLVGVRKDLLVRFDPDETERALSEEHVQEFIMRGRTMKGWVLVGVQAIEDDEKLSYWIQRAMAFVKTLPAK